MDQGWLNAVAADLMWELRTAERQLGSIADEAQHELVMTPAALELFSHYVNRVGHQLMIAVSRPSVQLLRRDSGHPLGDIATQCGNISNSILDIQSVSANISGDSPDVADEVRRRLKLIANMANEAKVHIQQIGSAVNALNVQLPHAPEQEATASQEVFLCHSTADKPFARKLATDLRRNGITVWFDEWAMLPGDSLYDKIQTGIQRSGWFLIVLSPNSVASKWCTRELHNAMEIEFDRDKVYVIPVLFQPCEIPGFLREKLYANCHGDLYVTGLSSLLERFRRIE